MFLIPILMLCYMWTAVKSEGSDRQFEVGPFIAANNLPIRIQSMLNYSSRDSIGFKIECRIRSHSTRKVNVTHIPSDDNPPFSITLRSKQMISLHFTIGDVFKINELLSFGDGEIEILGEELVFHTTTSNSVSCDLGYNVSCHCRNSVSFFGFQWY